MTSPVRVGIVGLSARATTSWAAIAHLPYLKASDKYEIVAIQNTSKASSEGAIRHFQLGDNVKAYGTPEELADDPNVQLVLISVRVDQHYDAVKPSILKGKDALIEWPVASTTKEAQELVELAQKSGSKIVVGLQGQEAALTLKLKELVDTGRVGKILSSTLTGYGGTKTRDAIPEGLGYFFDRKVGGTFVSIGGGHLLNSVHSVLGEFKLLSSSGQILRPKVELKDRDGKPAGSVVSNVPDQFTVYGPLEYGAHLQVFLRRGPPFKGTPALDWRIYGEKGEIRLSGSTLAFNAFDGDFKIQVEDYEKDAVEDIEVRPIFEELPATARNMAAVYEAFYGGDKVHYVDGEKAVRRHQELDQIWAGFDVEAKSIGFPFLL